MEIPVSKDEFADFFKAMPEGMGINVGKKPDGNILVHKVTEDELRNLADDAALFHIVFWMQRPGAQYFANYLEHIHFVPQTPENDEFEYRCYKWKETLWGIITIPIAKKDLAYQVAEETKMRIANGVPMLGGAGPIVTMMATRPGDPKLDAQVEIFPMATERVFVLENAKGDVIYDGPGGTQDAKISEDYAVHKLWEECGVNPPDLTEPDPWED